MMPRAKPVLFLPGWALGEVTEKKDDLNLQVGGLRVG